MFSGFSGFATSVFPTLRKEAVAQRVYKAIMFNEEEVHIPGYTYWICIFLLVLRRFNESLRMDLVRFLMGDGMRTLNVRAGSESKKC